MRRRIGNRILGLTCALLASAGVTFADTLEARLHESATVLEEVLSAPDKGIPRDLLADAHCVVVVPSLKKAAFLFGGKYGRGFVTCRQMRGQGWGAPAAVRMEGGSFGFQIGASETDLVLLVMNQRGMERLTQSRFTLGGEAEVAGGPVGRSATAQTDGRLTAKILSYSRSRGVFAGVSLQGATLRQDLDQNRELYGREISNYDILMKRLPAPAKAAEFLKVLGSFSKSEGTSQVSTR